MQDQVKNYSNDNQVISLSTSTHVTGISIQTIQIIKNELFNALADPEVLPLYKRRVKLAMCEISFLKGGIS